MANTAAGLEGMIVADSAITRIDGLRGELEYRGYPAAQLAECTGFEAVAHLLWHGELPSPAELRDLRGALADARAHAESGIAIMRALKRETHPLEALRVAVTALAADDPDRERLDR